MKVEVITYSKAKDLETVLTFPTIKEFLAKISTVVGSDLNVVSDIKSLDKDIYYLLFSSYSDLDDLMNSIDNSMQSNIILMRCSLSKLGLAAEEYEFAGLVELLDFHSNTPLMYGKRKIVEGLVVNIPKIRNIKNDKYLPFYDKKCSDLAELIIKYLTFYNTSIKDIP